MKLNIHSCSDRGVARYFTSPEYAGILAGLGVELVEEGQDLTIMDSKNKTPIYDIEGLVAIEDAVDSPILSEAVRETLWRNQCLGVYRPMITRHPEIQNGMVYQTDYCHVLTAMQNDHLITDLMWDEQYTSRTRIPHRWLSKIHLAFPLMPVPINGFPEAKAKDIIPLSERTVDVVFIGQVDYSEFPDAPAAVSMHREVCKKAILALPADIVVDFHETDVIHDPPKEGTTLRLPGNIFWGRLKNAKISICPWGWAEWSWRDVESIVSGCIPIKPYTGVAVTIPDIYKSAESPWMVYCKPDFSDLEIVIRKQLSRIDRSPDAQDKLQAQAIVEYNRQADLGVAVSRYLKLLTEGVEKHQWE